MLLTRPIALIKQARLLESNYGYSVASKVLLLFMLESQLMQTEVSEEGKIVIPASLRRKLGIKAGDRLDADVRNGNIVLSPRPEGKKLRKARIIEDPVTGLPVLDVGDDAPILTSEMVREMLADFP